jgi:hypothetical protein
MTAPPLVAFVDGKRVVLGADACVLDAVRAADSSLAKSVTEGERLVTDSRGLPIDWSAPVHGGAIFRIVPVRRRSAPASPTP